MQQDNGSVSAYPRSYGDDMYFSFEPPWKSNLISRLGPENLLFDSHHLEVPPKRRAYGSGIYPQILAF